VRKANFIGKEHWRLMFSTPLNPFVYPQSESALKLNFNESQLKKKYRSHNIYVQARVKSANILVYNIKDGWAPLCKFLGRPEPTVPFPRVNINGGSDGYMKTFWRDSLFMEKCKREAFRTITVGILCLSVAALGTLHLCGSA